MRRRCETGVPICALIVAVFLVLFGMLSATVAEASLSLPVQTLVAGNTHAVEELVGPHGTVLPGGSQPREPGYERSTTGSSFATLENAIGGTGQFLKTPSGGQFYVYDPATNAASTLLSRPSSATSSTGHGSIGRIPVDWTTRSAPAQSIAAEGDTWSAPDVYVNARGELTNGEYTVSDAKMVPHLTGSFDAGKSQWFSYVDAETATLDAASYADANDLWVGNTAKVPVANGEVGVVGRSGEPTSWINVYRTNTGFVHGSPGNAP